MGRSEIWSTITVMKIKLVALCVCALLGLSFAAQGQKLIRSPAHAYTCDDGKEISVTYLSYPNGGPSFAVLKWNKQEYGLAQAVSADGARYASLYGPTMGGNGLEWWDAQGLATLKTFMSSDTSKTRTLLTNCKTSNTDQ